MFLPPRRCRDRALITTNLTDAERGMLLGTFVGA